MKNDRLETIEKIFHEALEHPATYRGAFLAEACASDPELRDEVASLLSFEETDSSFIEDSPASVAAEMLGQNSSENLIGTSLGRYKIVQLLGVGGMGEVYLAEDQTLERKVALKVLPEAFVADEDRMARFLIEAKTVSALNHPNIITIHEIREAGGKHFIATEYIAGQTLRKYAASVPLTIEAVVDIAIQIASALEDAHSAGIIHRDIKPDNVMVRPDGLVKILDFGIAELIEPLDADTAGTLAESNRPGVIIGSANYMSPEQARGDKVDTRSDIFSFGSVMYEMVAKKKAFNGDRIFDTLAAITEKEAASLDDLAPSLPDSIKGIIRKAMEKDVAKRYQSATELLNDLRAAKQSLEFEAANESYISNGGKQPNGVPSDEFVRTAQSNHSRSSSNVWPMRFFAAFGLLLVATLGGYWYQYVSADKQKDSIAVMPFVNETGDDEIDYLSDGMTDNLIRDLSGIPGLAIKARSSVFAFKGRDVSAKQIGNELSVDAVLYGRLSKVGDRILIDIELVNAATLDVVWSQRYNRRLANLVPLQSGIARDVAQRLRPELSDNEEKRVLKTVTSNSEAQQLYLKGRFHWNKRNAKELQKAAGYFQSAIELDPEFALAYAGLADAYAVMPLYGSFRPNEYKPKAKVAALRALELNPNLAEAHNSLGYILNSYDFDWEGAEREYRNAIELNPNYATARQWYAENLAFRGRTDEALEQISKALELDPLSLVINRMKGNVLGFAGRHDEAIEQHWRTIELYPENSLVRINLGEAFAAKGMYKEAVEQFLIGLKMDGKKNYELRRLEYGFKLKGWKGFWMEYLAGLITLRKAIIEDDPRAYFANEHMAFAYAATGNREKALEFLEMAYNERDPNLITIRKSEAYDFLLNDPRYQELLVKIGLN